MTTASFRARARRLGLRALPASCSALVAVIALRAAAAPLALSDVPVFLSAGVAPNLIMAVDDSGSMDSEVLVEGNDGAAWWRTGAAGGCAAEAAGSFTGCVSNGSQDVPAAARLNFNHSGEAGATWRKFVYLFPNGVSASPISEFRRYGDSANDHFAIPPVPQFAWARSPRHNSSYFDPSVSYQPWVDGGGYLFNDASPTVARFDPVYGSSTINLTLDLASNVSVSAPASSCNASVLPQGAPNWAFRVYTGMTLPAGACILAPGRNWEVVRDGDCRVGVTNGCRVQTDTGANPADFTLPSDSAVYLRYFPATVYLPQAAAGIAGYVASPRGDGQAPDGSLLYRYEIRRANFGSQEAYDAAIRNFANWFTYHRKRHQALRAGLGLGFAAVTQTRVAGFGINTSSATSPNVRMLEIDRPADRSEFYRAFYTDWTGNGSTPNRRALANLVRNYGRTDNNAPITHSCQRNFGMLFTDGFSSPSEASDGIDVGNADGTEATPYRDSAANTVADLMMRAYRGPLRTDLPLGRVPVPAACTDPGRDPRIDCNPNLHLNFYAITLGTRGIVYNPDAPADPYLNPPAWPTVFPPRHPSSVDDLWHATINGRGLLLNARRTDELADRLASLLRSIAEVQGSASASSVSSGSINDGSRLFQASFNSGRWSGELRAFPIDAQGRLSAATSATIPVPEARRIFTTNTDRVPVPFRWGSLDAQRQAQLQPADTLGVQRLAFLRGDRSLERPFGPFRQRAAVLGDVINSSPVFVAAPAFRYPDVFPGGQETPYSAFRSARSNRQQMLYVGANDGMLHAFRTAPGNTTGLEEHFAFVPGSVFANLHQLSEPTYQHRYYVDGTPSVVDAFFGGAWRTVLVAGLNKGGQGIYALDVTDPAGITEANAANVVLWEFTDAQDADLGYSFSRPAVVRLRNGRWVAVFGNGYNNTQADGRASTTGDAVLYVVDLQTGSLLRKIRVFEGDPATPNGLATPAVIDREGDGIADYAYAGDLRGNVWKFDLTSQDPAEWRVAYGSGEGVLPLYVARNAAGQPQPITTRPQVGPGPNGNGFVVLVGTGKFLEASDRDITNLRPQSIYGLYDRNSGTDADRLPARNEAGFALTRQSVLSEQSRQVTAPDGTQVDANLRVTSQNPVDIFTSRGWYLDLQSPAGFRGEMQVSDPVLRNGRVVFTTLLPDTDICGFGGSGWLMDLDALTGSRLPFSPFDLNRDRTFNDADYATIVVDGRETRVPASGLSSAAIIARPAIIAGEDADFAFAPDTAGGITSPRVNPGPAGTGRQSWRQLR